MTRTDSQDAPVMDAALAWQALLAGNRRYASGAGHHPHQSAYRRAEVLPAQHPFAVIIFDFDSRGAQTRSPVQRAIWQPITGRYDPRHAAERRSVW